MRPGMSDDGAVIAFYGETPDGANPAIPGIFASFVVSGTRRTVRIARRQVENTSLAGGNRDGVCDAGETNCVDGELGLDAAGNPLFFGSFDADARVGVVRQDVDPLGNIEGDTFIISFIATPNGASTAPQYFSNQRGLWTIRVDVKSEQVGPGEMVK